MIKKILLLLLSIAPFLCQSQDILGKWKTIDSDSGEAQSIVELYKRDGKVYGKIVKLFRKEGQDPDPICDDCPKDDPRYGKKIIGMEIIKDLEKDGSEYVDGTVLKPDEGRIYKCKIWLDNGKLNIRGYWGFLYKTQEWTRAE
ncbi:DUF2147 domain-containing protein [Fulvivirga sediminis]|uniref:DUF2147 domain-containing protein n=1 Tax=Fulvivirga sediminis TaxID=2803949 RepID=A0A937K0L6_9BACT|nr:DUF2147 domain-containing protein [Fulvivirga sediminis]MBL3658478.1 DUF2147 domain-containing protein [Fulvivirga sediminis]